MEDRDFRTESAGTESDLSGKGKAFPSKTGAPLNPLLEAGIVLSAFYLPAYLPLQSAFSLESMAKSGYHLGILATDLPRIALLLYLMTIRDGLGNFGLDRKLKLRDLGLALFTAAGALIMIFILSTLFSFIGASNPLISSAKGLKPPSYFLAPLVFLSSLAVGYSEELAFRVYLDRRLRQAGLPPLWAGIAGSLLFGAGHGYEGIVGLASATLLGFFFWWRWKDGRNLHEIALGHGIYDAAISAIALWAL